MVSIGWVWISLLIHRYFFLVWSSIRREPLSSLVVRFMMRSLVRYIPCLVSRRILVSYWMSSCWVVAYTLVHRGFIQFREVGFGRSHWDISRSPLWLISIDFRTLKSLLQILRPFRKYWSFRELLFDDPWSVLSKGNAFISKCRFPFLFNLLIPVNRFSRGDMLSWGDPTAKFKRPRCRVKGTTIVSRKWALRSQWSCLSGVRRYHWVHCIRRAYSSQCRISKPSCTDSSSWRTNSELRWDILETSEVLGIAALHYPMRLIIGIRLEYAISTEYSNRSAVPRFNGWAADSIPCFLSRSLFDFLKRDLLLRLLLLRLFQIDFRSAAWVAWEHASSTHYIWIVIWVEGVVHWIHAAQFLLSFCSHWL